MKQLGSFSRPLGVIISLFIIFATTILSCSQISYFDGGDGLSSEWSGWGYSDAAYTTKISEIKSIKLYEDDTMEMSIRSFEGTPTILTDDVWIEGEGEYTLEDTAIKAEASAVLDGKNYVANLTGTLDGDYGNGTYTLFVNGKFGSMGYWKLEKK